jgi:hypothetical protein
VVKPTLKSAQDFAKPPPRPDFKLGTAAAKLGGGALPSGRPPSEAPPSTAEVAVAPVISVGGSGLGAMQLGASQLRAPPPPSTQDEEGVATPARPRAEPSGVLPAPASARESSAVFGPPKAVVAPVGPAGTTQMEALDETAVGVPVPAQGEGFGTAQTVPMIPPSLVASAIAMGPRPAAGVPAVPPAPPSAVPPIAAPPSGLPPDAFAPLPAPREGMGGTAPMIPRVVPVMPSSQMPSQLPPPTPPVYPMAPSPPAQPAISGARGLLIGFLAGAALMGIVALVYAFLLRR